MLIWPALLITTVCSGKLQNAIAADDANEQPAVDSSHEQHQQRGSDDDSSEMDDDDDDDDEVIDLSGMKCRAPYTHSWGEMSFHNAMILSVLPDQSQVCTARYSSYLTSYRWGMHCTLFILPDQSQVGYALRVIHPT